MQAAASPLFNRRACSYLCSTRAQNSIQIRCRCPPCFEFIDARAAMHERSFVVN